jgi:hypothetical protein
MTTVVCATPVICPTLVGRPHPSWKTRLRSYAWLMSEDVTVICVTLVKGRDSGRMPDSSRKARLRSFAQLQSYARLWWKDAVICPTTVRRYDSNCISQLRLQLPTLIDIMTLVVSSDSDRASWLLSKIVPHDLPTNLWKTTHGRARWLQHLTAQTL